MEKYNPQQTSPDYITKKQFKLAQEAVKRLKEKYHIADQTLLEGNGEGQKDPDRLDLYVDTHFVHYMFSELTAEFMYEITNIKRLCNENKVAITKLLDEHDSQNRWLQSQMFTTAKQSKRTDSILTKGVIDKYHQARKRLIWQTWKDLNGESKRQKRKIISMMRFYRRQQITLGFRKWKKITFTTPKPVKLIGFSEKEAHEILH